MGMQEKEFLDLLKKKTLEAEEILKKYLPEVSAENSNMAAPRKIVEAMNYSALAGGKRLRPVLMLEMYHIFGEKYKGIEQFAAAIEMIHTYSLVHDDLPAMDNDEYRRGKKTTWAVYGDAMGVLAGDGLLNYAFETAAGAFEECTTVDDFACVGRAMKRLGENAGIYGMIGGQVADMEAEEQTSDLTEEQILYIHTHKTGALIKAAMTIGAELGGAADETVLEQIAECAMNIGVAFQIQDDILDVTGDSAELGKPVGSDLANGKQTYVTMKGLEESSREVERLSMEALQVIKTFPGDHQFLETLVQYLINRRS